MSYWAQIDSNNIVLQVLVGDSNDPSGDEGYKWFVNNFGGTWVQTYKNNNKRKNYAGIGFTYDATRDAFISPKPIEGNWTLDENTCTWVEGA